MRSGNIEISLKIPLSSPDYNGVLYSEDAVKESCKNVYGASIIANGVVVGIAREAEYRDGCIFVNGSVFYGGTVENVKFDEIGTTVSDMEIVSFGICKE